MRKLILAAGLLAASLPAAAQQRDTCIATVSYMTRSAWGGNNKVQATQVCTNDTSTESERTLMISQVGELRDVNAKLNALIAALTELTKANTAFRDSFQKVVVDNQIKMRDQMVKQLGAIPGQVATNDAVVNAVAAAVATKLAADETFREQLKDK